MKLGIVCNSIIRKLKPCRKRGFATLALVVLLPISTIQAEPISLDDQVACQTAIEEVRWSHTLWPEANPEPKPPLSAVLSAAEIEGRLQAIEYIRFLRDKVPGYEKAQLATFGMQIGVRETRRVRGRYWLTREDVLGARQFDDQIALCGAPIEDHNGTSDTKWLYIPDGKCVGVPLRTLIPAKAANVLVAGRCFSASHDAHASVRSMGQTMALGQAAGTAAALAARSDASVDGIVAAAVQDQLRRDGAILE